MGRNKIQESTTAMKPNFEDKEIEELFQVYSVSSKRSELFPCFLFAILLYSISQIGIHIYWWSNLDLDKNVDNSKQLLYMSVVIILSTIGVITSTVTLYPNRFGKTSRIVPHWAVLLWSSTIISSIALRTDESVPLRLGLGWIILQSFLILITLPVRSRMVITYSVLLGLSHTGVVIWKGKSQPHFKEQLVANVLLLIGTNFLGILGFNMNEKKQRLTVQDLRRTLEVKDVMSVHAEEQQRLLLSVLPKHLADTMTQDSESQEGGKDGFKKIYMQRHEPVSILFADIVGFTAMSAALGSASKLVEILDELFSMFDKLAEQHSQVRIKILGDCYYCICGAPEERPDHAVLCVHMGLAVVEAIKYFQKRTNTAVDMRVGIHTGAVLAGILGQRQWQFDVYSKDVDLANLMESAGVPGKVHISDRTLSYLNGEFEVEPGHGETREEGLRLAGIKTYFITKVLKPFQAQSSETNGHIEKIEKNEDVTKTYNKRLQVELLSQDGDRDMKKSANRITLRFFNKDQEQEFSAKMDDDCTLATVGCCCALLIFTGTSFFVISFQIAGLMAGLVAFAVLFWMATVARKSGISEPHRRIYSRIKHLIGVIALLLLSVTNILLMIPCLSAGNKMLKYKKMNNDSFLEVEIQNWSTFDCNFPAYLIIYCSFFILSITLFTNFHFWNLTAISILIVVSHAAIVNLTSMVEAFRYSELFSFVRERELIPESVLWTLFAILFSCAFFSLMRRLELSARVRFLCKSNVAHQKELATQFRLKNEALMCNIMPQHVANHFLNPNNKSTGLYSENYLEAGVIFAAMPNFRDFYTEDAVNNQGLECLRFLNEVISDYDALLDLPKFNGHIIKIKTIGSTYMAASGLNPQKQCQAEDTMKERWRHLSLLVEFALEMKKVLNQINEQSYNQFVLKIGINHGPITAGVIGNTKPAYDIWGNTANVSSRMYSTGKADKIQITDETYRILRMYGYQFERRGMISVKGKGEILTYFLTGKGPELSEEEINQLD